MENTEIKKMAKNSFNGLHVEYLYSARDNAAVGYAHSGIYEHVAGTEALSSWPESLAACFVEDVKNDDPTIWNELDGVFPGVVKADGNADADGIGTAVIRIVNEDGETVAESCRVIYEA